MSLSHETVLLLREQRVRDEAGGWNITLAAVGEPVAATRNYYRRRDLTRIEEGAHGSQGPGTATALRVFFTFRRPFPYMLPFPVVRIGDRIVSAEGTVYLVHFVRQYQETLQADCEGIL